LSPWCPLNRRLGGPQSWSGLPVSLLGIKPSCPAHSLVTILTELMWLMKKIIIMFRKFSNLYNSFHSLPIYNIVQIMRALYNINPDIFYKKLHGNEVKNLETEVIKKSI
jgi:hypothetical protein